MHAPSHSHTAADTPESLRSCLGRLGDRDAPWENEDTQGPHSPTQQRIHPSPFRPARATWGIGTARGTTRMHKVHQSPHSGEYTRDPTVPASLG